MNRFSKTALISLVLTLGMIGAANAGTCQKGDFCRSPNKIQKWIPISFRSFLQPKLIGPIELRDNHIWEMTQAEAVEHCSKPAYGVGLPTALDLALDINPAGVTLTSVLNSYFINSYSMNSNKFEKFYFLAGSFVAADLYIWTNSFSQGNSDYALGHNGLDGNFWFYGTNNKMAVRCLLQ